MILPKEAEESPTPIPENPVNSPLAKEESGPDEARQDEASRDESGVEKTGFDESYPVEREEKELSFNCDDESRKSASFEHDYNQITI